MPLSPSPDQAFSPTKLQRADRLGAWAGGACAVHCALTPVVLALLPALGSWMVAGEALHVGFLCFLTVLAMGTTALGWRRHRRFYAWAFLLPGLGALWAGHGLLPAHEAVLTAMGGTLVVCAHLVNLRLAHGHVHDAQCAGTHRP